MPYSVATLQEKFWGLIDYYFVIKELNCSSVRGQMQITLWPSRYFLTSFEARGEEAGFKKMEKHASRFEGGP